MVGVCGYVALVRTEKEKEKEILLKWDLMYHRLPEFKWLLQFRMLVLDRRQTSQGEQ